MVKKKENKKCEWMNPPCKENATILTPRISMYICDEHYMLNILRFGCDMEGEPIKKE